MKVVIADDQRVVREGLSTIVSSLPEFEVVGLAANGAQAVDLVDQQHPDVVLMDLRMPEMDGIEATATIRERFPDTRVVVLTTYADDESVVAALSAGALGYLTKDAGRDDIRRALEAAVGRPGGARPRRAGPTGAGRAPATGKAGNPARRADRAGGRGVDAHRRGAFQHRDRHPSLRRGVHCQNPHQPDLHQDPEPGPHPGGRLRPPTRVGPVDRLALGIALRGVRPTE